VQNKGTKIITTLVISVAVAAVFYVLAFFPFRSRLAVQVSFCYTTNDPAMGFIGVFAVTNLSNDNLEYTPYTAQTLVRSVWSRPRFDLKALHQQTLSPHGTNSFIVNIPTNCEAWRAPVSWSYPDLSTMEFYRGVLKANISWNWQQIQSGQRLRLYNASIEGIFTAFSETITNK
jgi:hypothetical protein